MAVVTSFMSGDVPTTCNFPLAFWPGAMCAPALNPNPAQVNYHLIVVDEKGVRSKLTVSFEAAKSIVALAIATDFKQRLMITAARKVVDSGTYKVYALAKVGGCGEFHFKGTDGSRVLVDAACSAPPPFSTIASAPGAPFSDIVVWVTHAAPDSSRDGRQNYNRIKGVDQNGILYTFTEFAPYGSTTVPALRAQAGDVAVFQNFEQSLDTRSGAPIVLADGSLAMREGRYYAILNYPQGETMEALFRKMKASGPPERKINAMAGSDTAVPAGAMSPEEFLAQRNKQAKRPRDETDAVAPA